MNLKRSDKYVALSNLSNNTKNAKNAKKSDIKTINLIECRIWSR